MEYVFLCSIAFSVYQLPLNTKQQQECVDVSKKFLTQHHGGAFDDPRCELVINDAKKWLENTNEKFDVIINDLADPVEGIITLHLIISHCSKIILYACQ